MTIPFAVRRVVAAVAFTPALLSQEPPAARKQENEAAHERIHIGHRRELQSEILGETRKLMISLPHGYEESEQQYGIVYLLDGGWLFATAVAAVRHNAQVHIPLIVVGIENTDRTRDLSPPATKSCGTEAMFETAGGAADFRHFLVEDLRPFLRENYRTTDLSILIGHSLGGLFVFDTLVHQPDSFSAYFCMSPSLWWDDEALVEQLEDLESDHPMFGPFAHFSVGDEGGTMNLPLERVVWHYKDRAPSDCRWHVARFPGMDHCPVASPSLYDGLMAFFEPLRMVFEDSAITSFAELQARYDQLEKEYGTELKPTGDVIARTALRIARNGQVENALAFLDAAKALGTNPTELALTRGGVLAHAGRFDEAIRCLEAAAEKQKEEGDFFASLIKGAIQEVKKQQAEKQQAEKKPETDSRSADGRKWP